MDDRCMACHTDVRTQVQGHQRHPRRHAGGDVIELQGLPFGAPRAQRLAQRQLQPRLVSVQADRQARQRAVPAVPRKRHLVAGPAQHASGLLLLSRQGRQARGVIRAAVRTVPQHDELGQRVVRPQDLPGQPRHRPASFNVQDVPPDELQHLHLLRMPPAHAGQRPVRPRGQEPRRVGRLHSLPRRGKGGGDEEPRL